MEPDRPLILFVDDEPSNRVVFEESFGKKFRVACVDSGHAAIEILRREVVAVLVTDQRMPNMSGEVLLQHAKQISPDTLRIVVTAYVDIDPILHAVNSGLVVRYIVKPWTVAELDEILTWALQTHELGRTNRAIHLRLLQTERLLALGLLSSAMIHDLSQPLASISPNVHALQMHATLATEIASIAARCPDADTRTRLEALAEDLPELASELAERVEFMRNLIDSLKQFHSLGGAQPKTQTFEPVEFIKMAISMCHHAEGPPRGDTTYDGPAALPPIRGSSTELVQTLINLIRNAQQAVRADAKAGRVVVCAAADDDNVRFVVRDDGPGMTEEVLGKVGTPFFTTRESGTGLGLAQCMRLVGRLGGTLKVESRQGHGTTVSVAIPRAC